MSWQREIRVQKFPIWMSEYYVDLRTEFLSALHVQELMAIFSSTCVCTESSWASDSLV